MTAEAASHLTHDPSGYRPEIDGLRTVAVLTVVAFHYFPNFCRGGFVGVDVFFVISGFLITGILLRQRGSKRRAIVAFYAHRIRRIFPALLAVLIASASFGYVVLFPDEFAEFRREALSSCAFVANFLFARTDDYFDQASSSKILLHLWSLSIEEQFYLLWPAIVLVGKDWRFKGVLFAVVMAGSLLFAPLYGVVHPVATFFSPLARAWELGLGGWLAWKSEQARVAAMPSWPHWQHADGRASAIASACGIVGMMLILGSAFLIDAAVLYPGWAVVLPTLGTAMVIAARGQGVVARLLGSRPCVALGRISYPLYLWHWPLLVFAALIFDADLSVGMRVGLVLLATLLAQLTYRWIELPMRERWGLRTAALGCLAVMLIFAASLYALHAKSPSAPIYLRGVTGLDGTQNQALLTWFEADPKCLTALGLADEAKSAGAALFCSFAPGEQPASVALIGDSTANSLFPGMAHLYARSGRRIFNPGHGTCAPFRQLVGSFEWNRVCAAVNDKLYQYILQRPDITTVILSMTPWDIDHMQMPGLPEHPSLDDRFAAMRPLVHRDVAALTAAGKHVVITFDAPHLSRDPRACISNPGRCVMREEAVDRYLEPYRSKWLALTADLPEVCVFSQRDLFRLPNGLYRFTQDNLLLYRDDHHLSTLGSDMVANAFAHSACFQ